MKYTKETETTLFGTDGIRDKAGSGILTPEHITTLGTAIGIWATEKYGPNIAILLGHDTRISCQEIKKALCKGLLSCGATIYDAQVLPTPAVIKLVQSKDATYIKTCKSLLGISQFSLGIMLTASHNPYYDNGIKIVDANGEKLTAHDEQKITQIFYAQKNINKSSAAPATVKVEGAEETREKSHAGTSKSIAFNNAKELYQDLILEEFGESFLADINIILDCANGATYKIAPEIFERLGARVITLYNTPDGKNINNKCGSLYPEHLQSEVLKHNADIGFAFDGDGDRIVAISKQGDIKNGDDIICLLSQHPKYKQQTEIVGTIMTNYGLELYLHNAGKKLIRTDVGDKCVAQELKAKNLLLGGEPSGHIIMRDFLSGGDGIFAALRIIETAQANHNWDLHSFKETPQIFINIPVQEKKDLNASPYKEIIAEYKQLLTHGRIIVRYSGTEHLLRVMVEDTEQRHATELCKRLSKALSIALNQ